MTVVNPVLTPQGWQFGGYPGSDSDPVFAATDLHEIYTRADARFTGRATVPVLWDMARNVMVANESADILRMFDTAFAHLAPSTLRLCPADLAAEIDALEARPTGDDLFGDRLTETDSRIFVTLIRFDAADHGLSGRTMARSPTTRVCRSIWRVSAPAGEGRESRSRPQQGRLSRDQGAEPDGDRARRAGP